MCGIFMDREQLAERFAEAASMPRDVVMGHLLSRSQEEMKYA